MKYPLRRGRKQQRAVLDAEGNEVVVFTKGKEAIALKMVELFNKEWELNKKLKEDEFTK